MSLQLRSSLLGLALLICLAAALILLAPSFSMSTASAAPSDPRLAKSYRFEQGLWTYVHLEGDPGTVGFQHGYLLAPEIVDALHEIQLEKKHSTGRDWQFFRAASHDMLWPHIENEYQQELQGIVEGLKAHGVAGVDLDDVVALNAMEELGDYYVPWLQKREGKDKVSGIPHPKAPGNCSAFVATGSYTKDHQIVIAHNNWTNYMAGERWRMILDLVPAHGNRILMDGFPGIIISDDDFGVNSSGLMVTETTITQFEGFDPNGKPEFVRARKALQYANSIDDYVRIMLDGNNGGYANDWLLGDRKTGEVARFENGLKHSRVWRSKDGYFVGSNFASDPEVLRDETPDFKPNDLASSPNARRVRWEELMRQNKGRIDVEMAQQFLGDHYDSYAKKEQPTERALCGHVETSAHGIPEWGYPPYNPSGAVQGKAMDSTMARDMSFYARAGHPCGGDFIAEPFLAQHQEFNWMRPSLRDMKAGPWTLFRSGQSRPAQ
jgi:hypothetical protein